MIEECAEFDQCEDASLLREINMGKSNTCFSGKYVVPTQALAVRTVYVVHCIVITYRVVEAYQNPNYWLLLIALLGLVIETVVTFWRRGGREWRWFSPVIFCYLATALPPLWLLEIKLNDVRLQAALEIVNGTEVSDFGDILGVNIPISLDLAGWALAMEQSLLFILIIGRWVLPKGEITRNQLSQILLVYLGMAADIMELFEVFKEEMVIHSQHLIYPILVLWSWSLLQYTFVITSTKARKPRYGDLDEESSEGSVYETGGCCKRLCGLDSVNADVLGIMTTIVMQDGPFLCFRLYLVVGLNIVSQMMIFFTCKNLLVLLLQIYRLAIIYFDPDDEEEDELSHLDDGRPYNQKNNNQDIEMDEFGSRPGDRDSAAVASRPGSNGPDRPKMASDKTFHIKRRANLANRGRNRVTPSPSQFKRRSVARSLSPVPVTPPARRSWEERQMSKRRDSRVNVKSSSLDATGGRATDPRRSKEKVRASKERRPWPEDENGTGDDGEHPHSVGGLSSSEEEGYYSNVKTRSSTTSVNPRDHHHRRTADKWRRGAEKAVRASRERKQQSSRQGATNYRTEQMYTNPAYTR